MEEKTAVTQITPETIDLKLKELFGGEIAKAFADEDINCQVAIADLLNKESDSAIFMKLGLTYGKAIRFKEEFEKFIPREALRERKVIATPRPPSAKPSMGDLAAFSPDLRRMYLIKRKNVGVLASSRWKNKLPKFNTPQLKAELKEFAKQITPECSLPEAGFNTEGIEEHIKNFFCEQRRAHKNKNKSSSSSSAHSSGCSSSSEGEMLNSKPSLPSMSQLEDEEDDDDDDDMDKDVSDTESNDTQILFDSELDQSQHEIDTPQMSPPSDVSKLTKKSVAVVLKSVIGKLPDREGIVKVLKGKFEVQHRSLTGLTPSQLMETLARKLISMKYVTVINPKADYGNLTKVDLKVLRRIDN